MLRPAAKPKAAPASSARPREANNQPQKRKLSSSASISLKKLRQAVAEKNERAREEAQKAKNSFQTNKAAIETLLAQRSSSHEKNSPAYKAVTLAQQILLGALDKGIGPRFCLEYCQNYFAKKIKAQSGSNKGQAEASSSGSSSRARTLSKPPQQSKPFKSATGKKAKKELVKKIKPQSPAKEKEVPAESLEQDLPVDFSAIDMQFEDNPAPAIPSSTPVLLDKPNSPSTAARQEEKEKKEVSPEEAKKHSAELENLLAEMNAEWHSKYLPRPITAPEKEEKNEKSDTLLTPVPEAKADKEEKTAETECDESPRKKRKIGPQEKATTSSAEDLSDIFKELSDLYQDITVENQGISLQPLGNIFLSDRGSGSQTSAPSALQQSTASPATRPTTNHCSSSIFSQPPRSLETSAASLPSTPIPSASAANSAPQINPSNSFFQAPPLHVSTPPSGGKVDARKLQRA